MIIGRIIGAIRDRERRRAGRLTRDEHIEAIRRAMRRVRVRMDAIEARFDFPADCCPSCACGPVWHALCDKLERQVAWLVVLLRKRGGDADVREVERLTFDYLWTAP